MLVSRGNYPNMAELFRSWGAWTPKIEGRTFQLGELLQFVQIHPPFLLVNSRSIPIYGIPGSLPHELESLPICYPRLIHEPGGITV
jgi:hypothetical protein